MLRPSFRALSAQRMPGSVRSISYRSFGTTVAGNRRPSWKLVAASTAIVVTGLMFNRKIANESGRAGKQALSVLSPAQVTSRLRENEESYFVERGKGVLRYDVAQLSSNNPIEDDRVERVVEVPLVIENDAAADKPSTESEELADWMFWGVFDGHSGWTTSQFLKENLVKSVLNELDKAYVPASPKAVYRMIPDSETIDNAIKTGFNSLDDLIVKTRIKTLLDNPNPSKASASELLAPALSGSCALLAFYDTYSLQLRVAVTGDSRAVLGTLDPKSGQWQARALSTDQTGSNVEEAHRIRSEHPGEESSAIRNGRVLGSLEPTRAFGDARYKWDRRVQNEVAHRFFGRSIPSDLRSPPYVTAEPVVTTTTIDPSTTNFMVMGCDGLFEMLSNEEVVSLVVQWMKVKAPHYLNTQAIPKPGLMSRLFGESRTELGVEDVSINKDSQKPVYRRSGVTPQFTVQDDNVATHLIRNALGGADQDQVSMLVSIPAPLSRRYRDDMTVTVVFFGDEDPSEAGTVSVNHQATKNARHLAKL